MSCPFVRYVRPFNLAGQIADMSENVRNVRMSGTPGKETAESPAGTKTNAVEKIADAAPPAEPSPLCITRRRLDAHCRRPVLRQSF